MVGNLSLPLWRPGEQSRMEIQLRSCCQGGLALGFATEFATGARSMPLGRGVCHWGKAYAIGARSMALWGGVSNWSREHASGALSVVFWAPVADLGHSPASLVSSLWRRRGIATHWHAHAPSGIRPSPVAYPRPQWHTPRSSGKPSGKPSGKLT